MMKKTGLKTGAKKTGVPTSLVSQHKRMAKGEAIMKGGGKAMNMGGYAMKKGGSAHVKSCKCMACGGSAGY